jgi:hypothetical protein
MNHYRSLLLLVVFVAGLFLFADCKKKEAAPDYPQLMGSWTGETSQSQVIQISVDNFDGVLKLTNLKITVLTQTGGTQIIQQYNSDGFTTVNGTYFKYTMGTGLYGPAYVDGTFNLQTMTLNGNFMVYSTTDPNDMAQGTYISNQ